MWGARLGHLLRAKRVRSEISCPRKGLQLRCTLQEHGREAQAQGWRFSTTEHPVPAPAHAWRGSTRLHSRRSQVPLALPSLEGMQLLRAYVGNSTSYQETLQFWLQSWLKLGGWEGGVGTKHYAEQELEQVGTQRGTEVDGSEMNPKLSPCDSVLCVGDCVCVCWGGGAIAHTSTCCQSPDTTSTSPWLSALRSSPLEAPGLSHPHQVVQPGEPQEEEKPAGLEKAPSPPHDAAEAPAGHGLDPALWTSLTLASDLNIWQ